MDACGPWKHWSEGLLKDLNDSKQWILSNKNVVVIRDQFPKAKFHYLVLPRENISSIFDVSKFNWEKLLLFHIQILLEWINLQLTKDHVHLLDEMYLMALDVIRINGHQQKDFQIGFHAQPSMRHLHMHVISTDFDSPTLKTKRHWNSFHTELFIPYQGKLAQIST